MATIIKPHHVRCPGGSGRSGPQPHKIRAPTASFNRWKGQSNRATYRLNVASNTTEVRLSVQELSPESFAPYGQVCTAQDDGKVFDSDDAQLVLNKGTPRFYIMRLNTTGTSFNSITYHADVTQCLGGLSSEPWYMAVAAPSGSVEAFPTRDDLAVFRVPIGTFVKLHEGTWHAGPLFSVAPSMDFYNLELSDTNVIDHNTHIYEDVQFVLDLE